MGDARPTLRNFEELDDIKALGLTAADIESGAAATAAIAAEAATRSAADTAEAAARTSADATHAALTTTAHGGVIASSALDTDATMAANSDSHVPSQKAVKTAIANAGSLPQTHVLISVGPTDPTTLPNPVPSGDEYVWMKTDGNGALLDIISGKVA